MPGYPLTENALTRRDRLVGVVGLRNLLANVAVGVLAGLAVAHLRLKLGLPGHKILIWMTPVIIARLLAKHPVGTTSGALSAGCVSVGLGGNFAGDILFLPLVGMAGLVLDAAVACADRLRTPAWLLIPLMGLAGMVAGIICVAKRLSVPIVHSHVVFGLSGLPARTVSYALFGLAAGLVGTTLAVLAQKSAPKGNHPTSAPHAT